jgi:hypothetical protein
MPQSKPRRVSRLFDATRLTMKAWRFLEQDMEQLGKPLKPVMPGYYVTDRELSKSGGKPATPKICPILDFRKVADRFPSSARKRLAIVEQAEFMFEHLYPHLPFKTDRFHFLHPRQFLVKAREVLDGSSETEFHSRMVAAFSILRDAHTLYGLPAPYRGATAFLPFQMACVTDPVGDRRFVVSKVMKSNPDGFGHKSFGPGAEIVKWSGMPVEYHVLRAASRLPGGNPSADFARATLACTVRPLAFCQFPFDEEMPTAEIVYKPEPMSEELHAIRLPWGVARFPPEVGPPTRSFSINMLSDEMDRGRRGTYPEDLWKAQQFKNSTDERAVSSIPEAFEFQFTGGPRDGHPIDLASLQVNGAPEARLGYLRIKSFSEGSDAPGSTGRLVKEARRILALLDEAAPDGLILDIRSNPGGDIEAAERMLQMLTPLPITPENFHFANSRVMLDVLRDVRDGLARKRLTTAEQERLEEARLEFGPWLDDADADPYPLNPERLTSGQPLTDPDSCNDIGQVYHGPVLLLADAFTYSAADIFAAGFEDHEIGFIYGKDGSTGGGGANVWNHDDLLTKLGPKAATGLARLPRGVTMRLAIRRCSRVGRNAGKPVEDLGVNVWDRYLTNDLQDVLDGFPGIIKEAASILVWRLPHFRVDVANVRLRDDGGVSLDVRSTNITKLRFCLDDEVALEAPMRAGRAARSFVVPPVKGKASPSTLRIEGFSSAIVRKGNAPRLVTVRNVDLDGEPSSDVEENRAAARRRRSSARRRSQHRRRR